MKKPISIYVHIPFCVKKCNYCDFHSFAGMDVFFDAYVSAIACEIKQKAKTLIEYEVKTVFIGGGTPTILKPEQIGSILRTIKEEINFGDDAEITIEANPQTVSFESLSQLKSYGINRISFGLQSKNIKLLKLLGRIHDYQTFETNFNEARRVGFENINIDIMYALPTQTLAQWENTLDSIIGKSPEHISAYGLILEEGTKLHGSVERGELGLPSEDVYLQMYYMAKQKLKSAGYKHYEISNFCKPGYESRHNTVYWRCMEYVGFGNGSSSYIGAFRFRNENDLRKYVEDTEDALTKRFEVDEINIDGAISEFMFMGLRMMDGISQDDFLSRFNTSCDSVYGDTLTRLSEKGLLIREANRIYLTDKGIDISNYVFSELLL